MRLIIVRHGDPDYELDSLTETGRREAQLAAEALSKLDVKAFYTSPLGRAKVTAGYTLTRMKRTAEELPWLREFSPPWIVYPGEDLPEKLRKQHVPWDWIPSDWTKEARFYDRDAWMEVPTFQEGKVGESYAWVCRGFDDLLARHGYEREGDSPIYRAVSPNRDTIVLFAHFGVECVLLSHLIGVSPMVLWHGFCAAPTSMTTIYTEERRKGQAVFRIQSFGDIGHLTSAGTEPSFAARFRETYDAGERKD
jgi:probable phosphoglycerate mutase